MAQSSQALDALVNERCSLAEVIFCVWQQQVAVGAEELEKCMNQELATVQVSQIKLPCEVRDNVEAVEGYFTVFQIDKQRHDDVEHLVAADEVALVGAIEAQVA